MPHGNPIAEVDGVYCTRSGDPKRVQLPGEVTDEDGAAGDRDAAVERGSRAVRPENFAVCGVERRNEIASRSEDDTVHGRDGCDYRAWQALPPQNFSAVRVHCH